MELAVPTFLSSAIFLRCLTLFKAEESQITSTAALVYQGATDGEQFVRRIVHGEKISVRPEYLLFTAPYRLCEGECPDGKNFVFSFPLYIGKRGKKEYKKMYREDASRIHSMRPNAPFRKKTSRLPMSTCETTTPTVITTTTTPITTEVTTTTEATTDGTKAETKTEKTTTEIARTETTTTEATLQISSIEDSGDLQLLDLLLPDSDASTKKPQGRCRNYSGFCLKQKKNIIPIESYNLSDNSREIKT